MEDWSFSMTIGPGFARRSFTRSKKFHGVFVKKVILFARDKAPTCMPLLLRFLESSSKAWMPLVSISVTAAKGHGLSVCCIMAFNVYYRDRRRWSSILRDISTIKKLIPGRLFSFTFSSSSLSHLRILQFGISVVSCFKLLQLVLSRHVVKLLWRLWSRFISLKLFVNYL